MKAFKYYMAVALATPTIPAEAQDSEEDRVTLNILRECSRIADMRSRVACYDRNLGAQWDTNPATGPQPASSAQTIAPAPGTFGSNNLPPASVAAPRQMNDILRAEVMAVRQLEPGIFLLTLADGVQWQFVEAMPFSYSPPQKGGIVEISAAAMGSYLMRYEGQRQVRIRRVK